MPHMLREHEYTALGRVAVHAALLEAIVESFLSDAITPDLEVGVRAVRGMSFDVRAAMLGDLIAVRLAGTGHPEGILPVLKEARELMNQRNEFLHGLWQFDADANLEVRKRLRKTGEFHTRAVSADDLNRTADRLGIVAENLHYMYFDAAFDLGVFELSAPGEWKRVEPRRGLDYR